MEVWSTRKTKADLEAVCRDTELMQLCWCRSHPPAPSHHTPTSTPCPAAAGQKRRNPHGQQRPFCSPVTLAIVSPAVFNEQPSLKSIWQLRIRRRSTNPSFVHLCRGTRAQRWKCAGVNTANRCRMCPAKAASLPGLALALLARRTDATAALQSQFHTGSVTLELEARSLDLLLSAQCNSSAVQRMEIIEKVFFHQADPLL